MGVTYAGWSTTIDGLPIPPAPPTGPKTRGSNIDEALRRLARAEKIAKDGTARDTRLKRAIAALKRIPTWRKKS